MQPLINQADIKNIKGITDNITAAQVEPHVLEAQNFAIKPILQEALFNELLSQVESNTLSGANIALLPYVQNALVYHAYARYILKSNYQATQVGLRKKDSDNSEALTSAEINMLHADAKRDADMLSNELTRFLEAHKNDYPLWRSHCKKEDVKYSSGCF